ncbi:MAG: hypothetical protein WDM78_02710 [Puia sp.]
MVIFTYSGFSRLFSKWKIKILIPLASIVFSEIILFAFFNNINRWLYSHFGIRSLHLFISLSVLLIILILSGWKKRRPVKQVALTTPAWLVPAWFHIYFSIWFFLSGFNKENNWMTLFALTNLLLSIVIHLPKSESIRKLKMG